MIDYVGQLNIGGITPISLSVAGSLSASIATDIAAIAQLSVDLNVTPPSLAFNISAVTQLLIQFGLAIDVGLPSVDFQALAVADAIATLTAELAIPLQFQLLLGAGAGMFVYGYDGTTSAFGSSINAKLSNGWPDATSPDVDSNALIMATVADDVWENMLSFFGVIPPSLPAGFTYVAQANIGTLTTLSVTATVGVIADLEARLNGLIELAVQLSIHPPSFSTSFELLTGFLAALEAMVSLNLPGVDFQIAALADLIARLNAKLDLLASLSLALGGAAGVFVYTYSGPGSNLGSEITSALGSGWPDGSPASSHANAIVVGTVSPAIWSTIETFFGGI